MYLSLKLRNLHTCEVHQFSCTQIVLVHRKDSLFGQIQPFAIIFAVYFFTSACYTYERWYYRGFGGGKAGSSKLIVSLISRLGGRPKSVLKTSKYSGHKAAYSGSRDESEP